MNDIARHLDEILTHLTSDAIGKIFGVVSAFVAASWATRFPAKSLRSRMVQSSVATLFLGLSIWLALLTHPRSGFSNGAWFAVWCSASVFLALAAIHPFIRKFLPVGSKHLNWAKNPKMWTTYTERGGKPEIAPHSNKSIRFGIHFSGDENRWASMEVQFSDAQCYREWAGICFDIRSDKIYPGSTISLQINTSNGSQYLTGRPVQINNQQALFLFQEMRWADWTPESPHGYLDLQQVAKVAVVCHTILDDVEFSVSNFALVKFTDIPS